MMLNSYFLVTICHRFTPPDDLKKFCKMADIIVVATGVPKLIKADMVKPGAAVIDVGITRIFDEKTGKHKLVGDVDYEEVKKVAGSITPVPGKLFQFVLIKIINDFTSHQFK